MKIHLTVPANTMLFRFFYNVESFNDDSNGTKKFEPYQVKEPLAREEIAEIEKFMHRRIIRNNPDAKTFSISEYKGTISGNYVKRLKEIAKHYESAGSLIMNCASYTELLRCLDGGQMPESDIELAEPEIHADTVRTPQQVNQVVK